MQPHLTVAQRAIFPPLIEVVNEGAAASHVLLEDLADSHEVVIELVD